MLLIFVSFLSCVFGGAVLLIFVSFLSCVFCFVCLLPVSCVPNVVNVSGLSTLDCPFFIFSNVYFVALSHWHPFKKWLMHTIFHLILWRSQKLLIP